jgi:hypothetical protein
MFLPVGFITTLNLFISSNDVGITGQSPTLILQRLNDLTYFNGTTGFTGTVTRIPLTEIDSVNQPGIYSFIFQQSLDTTGQNSYRAFYNNPSSSYPGSAIEDLVYSNVAAQVNVLQIASAVASKILVNPAIPINSADIASNALLSMVYTDVQSIEANGAQESTLLSGITTIENDLTEILSIIQPLAGSNIVKFVFTDQNSNPIPGIRLTLLNTSSQIVLATGVSNYNGTLTLGLPNGTFNFLLFKSFVSFPAQPINLVVNGNATAPVSCTTFTPTAPTPTTCACYAYLVDASGNPIPNIPVRAKVTTNFPNSPATSTLITKGWTETCTDGTGYFSLNLIQGVFYEISIVDLWYTLTDFQIPTQSSLDLSTKLALTV